MMDPNSTLQQQAMAHGVWKTDEAENYFLLLLYITR